MPKSRNSKKSNKRKYVPYVKGFRPPNKKDSIAACLNHSQKKEFAPHTSFKLIPKCTSQDDWLAQYCDQGQSFFSYIETCPWLSEQEPYYINQSFNPSGRKLRDRYPDGAIYIVPLGEFDSNTSPDFTLLLEYAQIFFDLPVKTLPKVELTVDKKFKTFSFVKSGRNLPFKITTRYENDQYQLKTRSEEGQGLLEFLDTIAPDDAFCTIALTMSDLYQDDSDLFVAGLATILTPGNHVGVFSLCRYDPTIQFSPEFWNNIEYGNDHLNPEEKKRLILTRSCRLITHEIAHTFGIGHCIYYQCLMNGSGHLAEDFQQPMFLCPVDLHKLEYLCGFDIIGRYMKMKEFFQKIGLVNDIKWIDKRLSFIKD